MPNKPSRIAELSPALHEAGLRLALRPAGSTIPRKLAELRKAELADDPTAAHMWGAFRGENLAGCLLVQMQPGRTAMLWPPRLIEGEAQSSAERLLAAGIDALSQTDVRLVQSLLPTDAGIDADLLRAAGFQHFSDLLYLVCPGCEFPAAAPAYKLEFVPVEMASEPQFAALVQATYEGTLDCPAVNGLRSMEDVLRGYRATGKYDPKWWLFVRRQGENLGCLIVTDYPEHEACELVYVGLVPAARGRGLGVDVVRHALWLAAIAKRQRLVLAVDAANEPALKMYAAAGMQAWDRKSVFIGVMPEKRARNSIEARGAER